jgi:hypothetical protein
MEYKGLEKTSKKYESYKIKLEERENQDKECREDYYKEKSRELVEEKDHLEKKVFRMENELTEKERDIYLLRDRYLEMEARNRETNNE